MKSMDRVASPQMIVYFICATFGFLSFISAFFTLDVDSLLAMGVIRLILGTIYFLGALINIFKGVPGGNLNLISAVCFGLFAGTHMSLRALESLLDLQLEPLIFAVVQFFAGLYILLILLALIKLPAVLWVLQAGGGFGLVCLGLETFFNVAFFQKLGGICFLVYGLCSLYGGVCTMIDGLPFGPSLQELLHLHPKNELD